MMSCQDQTSMSQLKDTIHVKVNAQVRFSIHETCQGHAHATFSRHMSDVNANSSVCVVVKLLSAEEEVLGPPLRLQRYRISCFQVAIWLKYR